MLFHAARIYRILVPAIVLFFAAAACQFGGSQVVNPDQPQPDAGATALPASAEPTATSLPPTPTSPPPSPTPVPTETTPPVDIPAYPAFGKTELLPDDLLVSQQPPAIPSRMQIMPNFGGLLGPCMNSPEAAMPPGLYFEDRTLTLCENPDSNEVRPLTITLTRPDGSTVDLEREVEMNIEFCLGRGEMLEPGDYQFQASSGAYAQSGTLTVGYDSPQVFLGSDGGYNRGFQSCTSRQAAGQPLELFFAGFDPESEYLVMAYAGGPMSDYMYQASWTAVTDSQGRLMQYIQSPALPPGGSILILVDTQEAYQQRGMEGAPMIDNAIAFAIIDLLANQ